MNTYLVNKYLSSSLKEVTLLDKIFTTIYNPKSHLQCLLNAGAIYIIFIL